MHTFSLHCLHIAKPLGIMTVAQLRSKVSDLTGADASILRYLGKPMEDDAKTLTEAGLKNNRTITCCRDFTMDEV